MNRERGFGYRSEGDLQAGLLVMLDLNGSEGMVEPEVGWADGRI